MPLAGLRLRVPRQRFDELLVATIKKYCEMPHMSLACRAPLPEWFISEFASALVLRMQAMLAANRGIVLLPQLLHEGEQMGQIDEVQ